MGQTLGGVRAGSGPALAGVQFFFTLVWTAYVLHLPGLLATAGIAASWLPLLLMADQLVFALMDIAFGAIADRVAEVYRQLARLLLVLSTVSTIAFLLLPTAAGVSPDYLAGHSFGELTALCAAGVLDEAALVKLARRRGEIMNNSVTTPGGMLAVLLTDENR